MLSCPGWTWNFSEMLTVLLMWKNQNWHSDKAHYQKNGWKYEKCIGTTSIQRVYKSLVVDQVIESSSTANTLFPN